MFPLLSGGYCGNGNINKIRHASQRYDSDDLHVRRGCIYTGRRVLCCCIRKLLGRPPLCFVQCIEQLIHSFSTFVLSQSFVQVASSGSTARERSCPIFSHLSSRLSCLHRSPLLSFLISPPIFHPSSPQHLGARHVTCIITALHLLGSYAYGRPTPS